MNWKGFIAVMRPQSKDRWTCSMKIVFLISMVLLIGGSQVYQGAEAEAAANVAASAAQDSCAVELAAADTLALRQSIRVEKPLQHTDSVADTLQSRKDEGKPPRLPRMVKTGDYLLIYKSRFTLEHYRDGVLLATYPVAVGENPKDKARVGDHATPEGHFNVSYITDSRNWKHDFGDGKGPVKGAYGPYFISLYTSAQGTFSGNSWRDIGIHGTHNPASIGTNASEGCIRMYNEDIPKLKAELQGKKNVPVDILP